MKSFKIPPISPLFLALLIIFIFPFLISPVQGAENYTGLNLTDIPYRVSESLDIDLLAGQLLCSIILMMICILPITIIARSKHASFVPELAVTFVTMGFCIAIDWLPVWFFLVLSMLVALMFAGKMRDVITGSAGK